MKLLHRARFVIGQAYLHCLSLFNVHRIQTGISCKAYGIPIIDIRKGCKLIMGNNVVLNSLAEPYHAGMYGAVKIMADREGATISIGDDTRIHGSCIHAYKSISIGKNCLIAANCQIMDGSGHDASFNDVDKRIRTIGHAKVVVIEDSVWLGLNTIVLPGVRIGRGSIISAGSVVCDDIPPMCIARGNPAMIIKRYGE